MNVKCTHPNCYRKANSKGFCPIHRPQPIKGDRSVKAVLTNLKKQAIQRKRKVTGEGELFKEIAQERPHICFVTGTPILHLTHWNCAHILSKGSFGALRLVKENIVLVQRWVHDIYDCGDRSKLEKYEGYHKMIEIHDRLIREYYDSKEPLIARQGRECKD